MCYHPFNQVPTHICLGGSKYFEVVKHTRLNILTTKCFYTLFIIAEDIIVYNTFQYKKQYIFIQTALHKSYMNISSL